ncbi:hypothetical protein K435DRAFT_498633 [Dendrothele bispora CBS 962.96]|uniref:Uncharacterized protein n=1 Tax=Dendrothele bispora (strain CBS 962.96) TaxID=1314807 RepID=A0A4S8MA83_DENBC|nr:hypothetical protein K435DRAFT_498633 [Dendrothele bispora CBS 962.96]
MPQTSSATQDPSSSLLFAPVLQDKSIGGITTTQSTMDPSYRSASRVDFRRGESSSALKTSVPQPASGVQAALIFAPTPREKNTTGNNGQIATAPSGTEPTYRSASRADFRKGEKSLPSKTTTGPQILETSDPSPMTVGAVSSYAPYDSASRLIGSQQGSFSENPPATSISQKMVRDNETKARNGTDSPYSQLKKDEKSSPVSNIMLSNKPQISPSWPNRMPESVPQQGYNMHVTPPTPVKRTPSGDQNGQPLADSLRYNIESPLNSFKNANTAGTTRRSGDPNENMRPQITSGDNSTRPVDRSSVNPLPEYPQESFAQRAVPIKASQHKAEHEARTSPSYPIQSMVDPANSGIKFPAREDRGANYSIGTPKQSSPQFNVSLTSNGRGRVVSISASNDGSPLNRIVSEVTAGSNNPSPRRVSEHVGYSPSARPPMIGGRSLSTDSGTAALARPEVSHFSTSKNAPPSGSSPGSRRVEPDRHLQTVQPATNANADNAYPTAPSHSTQYPNNVSMTQQPGPPYGGMVSSAKPHGFSSASTQAQFSLSQQQQAFNGILSTKPHNLSSVSAQVHPSVPQQQLGQSSNGTANPKSYSFSSASAHAYPNTQNSGPINSGSAALRAGFSSASAQAYPAISQHTGQANVGTDARSYPNMSSASAQAYPATAQHAGQVHINTDVRPHLGMSSASGQLNMYQQAGNPATTSGKPQTVQSTPIPTTGRHMADPSRERLNQNSAMSAIANPYRHPKLAELLSDEPQRPLLSSHADAPYSEYQNAQAGISQGIPQQSSGHPSFQPSPVSRAISAAVKTPSDEVDSQLPGGNPPSAAGFYGSFSSRYSPPKYNSTVSASSRRQHDASQKDHAMASSTLKSNDFRTMSTQPPLSNPITLPTTSDLQRGTANVNVSENFVSSHQQTPFERPPSSRPNDYSYKPADNPIVSTSTSVNGRVRSSAQVGFSRTKES